MMTDPLETLVVDQEAFAREELANVLRPFLRITGTGQLVFERQFDQLSAIRKVACALLGLAAAQMLGLRDRAGATPQEVVEISGLAGGTVRPKLSDLLRERYLSRDGSDYVIPPHAIRRVSDLLGARTL